MQHWAAKGGADALLATPAPRRGTESPHHCPLSPFAVLNRTSFPHKDIVKKKRKISFRKTLDHIKIQVVLSELEN